jgi:hypothetical protein
MIRLLDGQQLDGENFVQLGGYLAHSLEVFEELTYLGYGRETNGDYIYAERVPHGPVRVREYVADESGQRIIRDSRWQGARREVIQTLPWDGYDPRKRPFYQLAVASRTNVWTETYQFWQSNERGAVPGVTYATPRFNPDGRLLGVLNADFDLAALAHFLAEVKAEIPGYAFVVERRADGTRRLIAHPDPAVGPPKCLGDERPGLRSRSCCGSFRRAGVDERGAAAKRVEREDPSLRRAKQGLLRQRATLPACGRSAVGHRLNYPEGQRDGDGADE